MHNKGIASRKSYVIYYRLPMTMVSNCSSPGKN